MTSRITYNDKNHRYWLDGKRSPSVTTIINNAQPKVGLRKWYAKEAARWAANHVDLLEALDVDAWIEQAAVAPFQRRDKSGLDGTTIHQNAHSLLTTGAVDVAPEHVAVIEQAARFLDRWDVQEIAAERPCAHLGLRYTGTFDLLAKLSDGRVWMLDWKSGDNLYPEMGLQLAAYASCDIYQRDEETDVEMPAIDALGIVHLSASGWELIPIKAPTETLFGYFRLMRYVSDYTEATGGWPNPQWPIIGDPLPKPDLATA